MNTSLSAEAVNALIDAAVEAQPDAPEPAAARVVRVREVDFERPTKFSPEHIRRVRRAIATFAQTCGQRLSGELRTIVELEVTDTTQLAWAKAHALMPGRSVDAILAMPPSSSKSLLSIEPGFVLGAIELLLGGSNPARVKPRRLTDIDWAIARIALERIVETFDSAFQEEFGQPVALAGGELHRETAGLGGTSDPALVIALEARMDGATSAVQLILPWACFEQVAEHIETTAEAAVVDGATAALVRAAMSNVGVPVRAEIAGIDLPLEQVLALRPGDTLVFETQASAGVTLYADDVPIHVARPGRSGPRRAVQILWPAGGTR